MRIGLLSDTHGFLDDAVFTHFAECDEVWHAGDIGSIEIFDRLSAFKTTRAVYGNVDGAALRATLPQDLVWNCGGVHVYMTHIGGYPGNYDRRAKKELAARRPALFICGHSHILKVMRDPALSLLHMNPGACGHQGWHLMRTLLRFTADAGKISAVEAIELGPRGPPRRVESVPWAAAGAGLGSRSAMAGIRRNPPIRSSHCNISLTSRISCASPLQADARYASRPLPDCSGAAAKDGHHFPVVLRGVLHAWALSRSNNQRCSLYHSRCSVCRLRRNAAAASSSVSPR